MPWLFLMNRHGVYVFSSCDVSGHTENHLCQDPDELLHLFHAFWYLLCSHRAWYAPLNAHCIISLFINWYSPHHCKLYCVLHTWHIEVSGAWMLSNIYTTVCYLDSLQSFSGFQLSTHLLNEPGMIAHTYNPRTQEVESIGSGAQGQTNTYYYKRIGFLMKCS